MSGFEYTQKYSHSKRLRGGRIFSHSFIANFLLDVPMKEF